MSDNFKKLFFVLALAGAPAQAIAKGPPEPTNEPKAPAAIVRVCAALPDPTGNELRPLKAYMVAGNRGNLFFCMGGTSKRRWNVNVNHVIETWAGGAATAGDASRRCDPSQPKESKWAVCSAKRFISVNRNVEVCLDERLAGQPNARPVCPTKPVRLGTHVMVHVRWTEAETGPSKFGTYMIPLAIVPSAD